MKKLLRKIFIYLPLILICLTGFFYFVITSGFFLKFIGLPLTGILVGTPISVENIDVNFCINPHLSVNGLTFGNAKKPFFSSRKIYLRFELAALLKGCIKIVNVDIDALDINMALSNNGQWNIPWMNEESSSSSPTKKGAVKSESPPLQLDISSINIRNVNFTFNDKNDLKFVLKNFNIQSDSFRNQQESSVRLTGNIEHFIGKNIVINNGLLNAILRTNINKEYFPMFLRLDSNITNFTGVLKGKAIANRSFKINAQLTPQGNNLVDVSDISLKEYARNILYSSLAIKGKVTLDPFGFDLDINADPVGSDTINLVSNSLLHTDVGDDAKFVFKGNVSLLNNLLTTRGNLKLTDLLLTSPIASKKKELVSTRFEYELATDFCSRKIDFKKLNARIDRNSLTLINMSLKKPASILWSDHQVRMTDESPEVIAKISDIKLASFNEFLPVGSAFSSGVINSNLNLKINSNGSDVSVFGNINMSDVSYKSSDLKLDGISLNQAINLVLNEKKILTLKKCVFNLNQNSQKLLKLSLNGNYNFGSGDGELRTSIPFISCNSVNLLPNNMLSKKDKNQLIATLSQPNFIINAQQVFNVKCSTITIDNFLCNVAAGQDEKIAISLNQPLKLVLNDEHLEIPTLPLKIELSNFNLAILNSFLGQNTTFQEGQLNLTANAIAEKQCKRISVSGIATAKNISGKVNANLLRKAGINTTFNIKYDETGILSIKDCIANVLYDNKDAANISANGTLGDKGTTSIETQFKANQYLLKALNKTGDGHASIRAFSVDGNLKIKTVKDSFSLDGSINMPALVITNTKQSSQIEKIRGSLDISVLKKSQCIHINSANLNLYSSDSNICDIKSSGKVLFSNSGQSNLELISNKIDLEKILYVYGILFPSNQNAENTKNSAELREKEPAPIDLRGINLVGSINFNDIQYGRFIHMMMASRLVIKNNVVALLPLTLKMNQGQLQANIYINPSLSDGYTYEVKSQLKNIDINPLLKTFVEGDFSNTSGTISSLEFSVEGKGIKNPNLLNNLNGAITANCNNFSLPLDISKNKFLALVFIPIQIISNISQKLPNTPLPSDLSQAMSFAGDIITQHKNINFREGNVVLRMNSGITNIEKFHFSGGNDDIIKLMKFGGTIGPDNKLNLKTNTNFGKLDIPLNFYGTVEKPRPDIPAFIAGFITKNAVNILDVTKGILNSAPVSKGSGGEQVQQLGNVILDTAKGVLDKLTSP